MGTFVYRCHRQCHIFIAAACIICLFCGGCTPFLNSFFNNSLPPTEGTVTLPGLSAPVTVQRDSLGIPFVDAKNLDDLVLAMGYVNACDRFTQMEAFRLVGQGRLSEMLGKAALEMDMYLRALDLTKSADILCQSASPELMHLLQRYSDGVNAWMAEDNLPMTLKLAGHTPEKWEPIDSVSVFVMLSLALAQNLHEEIDILNLAGAIDPGKLAWLTPVYPDEPLPFEEMKKLDGIDLSPAAQDLQALFSTAARASRLIVPTAVASNNWAIAGNRTASGRPILANDTHLPISLPSNWHMMKLRCPDLEGAGVCLAGVPGIIAGYNRHIAVGMTMVMADNQDIFLEKLEHRDDGLYYLHKGQWRKTGTRTETFKIKGKKPVTITVHETVHGPLMNNILTHSPRHMLMPHPPASSLGIAVRWAVFQPDHTMASFFNIMKARSVDDILAHTGDKTSIIPLNLVMADQDNIAWQVTGRFPLRKNGRGLCPSPGWAGEYDWEGFLDPARHPRAKNPEKGYVGTANNRTVPADFPYTLSSSWYYPDRAQRIDQMIESVEYHTTETVKAMQLDTRSPFVPAIKQVLLGDPAAEKMTAAWMDNTHMQKAETGLNVLRDFNGDMRVDSAGAAFCGAFLSCLARNLFADECGGTDTLAWESLLELFTMSYSALHDHLTDRGRQSPFWDDITTEKIEKRHEILAKSVVDAVTLLEKQCGPTPDHWQWGDIHQYAWITDATRLSEYMGFFKRTGIQSVSGYFDRGPYPAPGDHTTLNVSAYHPGKDFDVWLIPAMRIIADFGKDEPLIGINSTGQMDNPASPHYDDGIQAWRKGEYNAFPFQETQIRQHYDKGVLLIPEDRATAP
ncbi:MAG: penicillin acylase family protein [Thermodesulfobacteriota bacterium]|nr:penicillin acylase family protein [Thermodesulfobacteriota bacterium]